MDNLKVLTLDSIATLKGLIGTGGSNVTLLDEYTATASLPAGSTYSASYLNGRLDAAKLALGKEAAVGNGGTAIGAYSYVADNTQSTAIGNSAQANSTATDYSNTAIGTGTNATKSSTVAIGHQAVTSRDGEVSIGNPSSSVNVVKTRYLANVRAGVLDTDAVNLKQLNDAIAEAGGGAEMQLYKTNWSNDETITATSGNIGQSDLSTFQLQSPKTSNGLVILGGSMLIKVDPGGTPSTTTLRFMFNNRIYSQAIIPQTSQVAYVTLPFTIINDTGGYPRLQVITDSSAGVTATLMRSGGTMSQFTLN